jgi:NADH:ubiquinone oxidoreductase subunit H
MKLNAKKFMIGFVLGIVFNAIAFFIAFRLDIPVLRSLIYYNLNSINLWIAFTLLLNLIIIFLMFFAKNTYAAYGALCSIAMMLIAYGACVGYAR